ncbi:PH domain-containing protein [Catelliglobosispora koreensis]|uniref:PH domain-containing protein n=1 Tax=Catelliglobosispora koreensis TaxID=129052 RepID=UPI003898EBBD
MTRFRYPTPLLLTAFLALFVAIFAFGPDGYWYVALIPALAILFLLRVGTDVNSAGLRVKSLFGKVVVLWPEVAALTSDQRGRGVAALTNGGKVSLLAVRSRDLPRLMSASGMTPAEQQPS